MEALVTLEVSVARRRGRPAIHNNAAKAQAAWSETRRLRRKSASTPLQEALDAATRLDDTATDDQRPATEVQDTQDCLVDQLEDLSLAGVRPSDKT